MYDGALVHHPEYFKHPLFWSDSYQQHNQVLLHLTKGHNRKFLVIFYRDMAGPRHCGGGRESNEFYLYNRSCVTCVASWMMTGRRVVSWLVSGNGLAGIQHL